VNRDYQTEPMLCKNYRMSPDMKTYTFYVENATFSSGAALTAQDVVATYQAAKESQVYGGRFRHINEITLAEDGGVQLRLDTPMENLPILLDIPIIPEKDLESGRPAGTGPYVLDETGDVTRLRRRSDWWCKSDLMATASSITLQEAENNPQIRDEFQFGELDLVCADPGSDKFADFRSDFELWNCENGMFLFLACSMDSEVFSNSAVRAALTHAVNRDYLSEKFYRGYAYGVTLPASPKFPYYSKALASRYAYDPERFAKAVTDAGMTDAHVVLLVNADDSLRVRAAEAIAYMLEAGGLDVSISRKKGNAYQNAVRMREYDLYLGQTRLSPNMDLSPFFSTWGDLSYGGVNNVGAYALCLKALDNYGNYYTLHSNVMENGLLCPILFQNYAIFTTRGELSGLVPSRDNIFYYTLGKTMTDAKITQ
jgi:peptide/nickel transport system substrate-binding protein